MFDLRSDAGERRQRARRGGTPAGSSPGWSSLVVSGAYQKSIFARRDRRVPTGDQCQSRNGRARRHRLLPDQVRSLPRLLPPALRHRHPRPRPGPVQPAACSAQRPPAWLAHAAGPHRRNSRSGRRDLGRAAQGVMARLPGHRGPDPGSAHRGGDQRGDPGPRQRRGRDDPRRRARQPTSSSSLPAPSSRPNRCAAWSGSSRTSTSRSWSRPASPTSRVSGSGSGRSAACRSSTSRSRRRSRPTGGPSGSSTWSAPSALLVAFCPLLLIAAVQHQAARRGAGHVLRRPAPAARGASSACLKLRTMVPNAEQRLAALHVEVGHEDGLFKMADDPRITKPGRGCGATRWTSCPSSSTSCAAT